MNRAVNRKGWGSSDTLDADELNTYIPRSQIYIPAASMSLAAVEPAIFQNVQIAARDTGMDVMTFIGTGTAHPQVYFQYQFFGIPFDVSDPQFVLLPLFFQNDVATPTTPNNVARMQYSLAVSNLDDDFDINYDANEVSVNGEVADEEQLFNSGTAGDVGITGFVLNGAGTLAGDAMNCLSGQMERVPDNAADTFTSPIHLLGLTIQWKTDFNNVQKIDT